MRFAATMPSSVWRGRHTDVDHGAVGFLRRDRVHETVEIARFRNDVDPGIAEHTDDSLPREHHVFGDDDAHGASLTAPRAAVASYSRRCKDSRAGPDGRRGRLRDHRTVDGEGGRTMSSTIRIALASALLALGIGSGMSLAGPPPEGGKTVTLTLANPEPRSRAASQIAEVFAARAKRLSKGKVLVKIVYEFGWRDVPAGEIEANADPVHPNGEGSARDRPDPRVPGARGEVVSGPTGAVPHHDGRGDGSGDHRAASDETPVGPAPHRPHRPRARAGGSPAAVRPQEGTRLTRGLRRREDPCDPLQADLGLASCARSNAGRPRR